MYHQIQLVGRSALPPAHDNSEPPRLNLQVQLDDNLKAHVLQPDGTYEKIDRRGKAPVGAQDTFCREAEAAVREAEESADPVNTRVFVPVESDD